MKIDRDIFIKDGFILIKNLFSTEEVENYKRLLLKVSRSNLEDLEDNAKWEEVDGVSKRKEFWPLIYNKKLLNVLRTLVPSPPQYLQFSDLHVNVDSVGWHRDLYYNKLLVGDDAKKIGVLRVGMYFHSYEDNNFKMGFLPGTHFSTSLLNKLENRVWSLFRKMTGKLPFYYFFSKPKWLKIDAGDCMIFDTRILHTGSAITGQKLAIYTAYGEDNNELSRSQVDYLHSRKDLNYSHCSHELAKVLREKDLMSKYLIEKPLE